MEYGRYVGRVGALAVALGIGVAVANGGVANATTDPDPSQDASEAGNLDTGTPPADNSETNTPEGPETPPVVINRVEQNGNEGATHRRVKPRVMFLDILRGANILGARRPAGQDPAPVKQPDDSEELVPVVDPGTGGTVAKLTAPTGSDPVKQVVSAPRALQRTIAAIIANPQTKDHAISQTAGADQAGGSHRHLRHPVEAPSRHDYRSFDPRCADTRTTAVASVTDTHHLEPAVVCRSSAGEFPPSSPLAPIGRLLEFVYAGLRRVDHQLFNQSPTGTALISGEDPVTHEQLGTDPKTGVVTGRVVGVDPDDAVVYRNR